MACFRIRSSGLCWFPIPNDEFRALFGALGKFGGFQIRALVLSCSIDG